jgi:diphthamide synthase (EF-2-diphthine--ammonia ligase)
MHSVRENLLEMQAAAAGLPLVKVPIPAQCRNQDYEQAMSSAMERARAEGVFHIVFGDLFLEDIRAYREKHLAARGMKAVFPLWRKDTRLLARENAREWPFGVHYLRRSNKARSRLRRAPIRRGIARRIAS